ncbi:MAG: hypothetical protein ACYDHU_11630 [Acidimicrobiales bacterium]
MPVPIPNEPVHSGPASAVASIPLDLADLSPQWLTDVLRPHAPRASVVAARITDSHSGTTGRALLHLDYAGDAGPLPSSVFCKLAPFDPRQRRLLHDFGIGAIEARFYTELAHDVAGRVGVRLPMVWHARADTDGSFIMVLEDLVASGCRFRRRPAGGGASDGEVGAA